MATRIITVPRGDNGNVRFQVEMDGVVFTLLCKFNTRSDIWYFDLLTRDGTAIRRSIKMTTGFPWLRQIATTGRPGGDLLAIDTTNSDLRTTLDELNNRISMVYEDAATVP